MQTNPRNRRNKSQRKGGNVYERFRKLEPAQQDAVVTNVTGIHKGFKSKAFKHGPIHQDVVTHVPIDDKGGTRPVKIKAVFYRNGQITDNRGNAITTVAN